MRFRRGVQRSADPCRDARRTGTQERYGESRNIGRTEASCSGEGRGRFHGIARGIFPLNLD